MVFVFKENATIPSFDGKLRVLGVEEVKAQDGVGLPFGRFTIGSTTGTGKTEVYYDFVGDKLVIVGRIGWRPYEGFRLSGKYKRAEPPK